MLVMPALAGANLALQPDLRHADSRAHHARP